jgi:uncharacterized protein YecE (DUF72 family)
VTTYLESVREQFERLRKSRREAEIDEKAKATAQWTERLTPLEERLRRLLSQMPEEVIAQGLSLDELRRLLAGKWRGNCHPGELGAALRKLGFIRRRNWSEAEGGFRARWLKT